jgi:hypothetical protein
VDVARIDRTEGEYHRTLVMPAEEGGASEVDCLLVQHELPRLGRELFLDRGPRVERDDEEGIGSIDQALDDLQQRIGG